MRHDTNIESLYLGGFQTIEDVTEIKLSAITLLFGPNSAGKSSIYDAYKLAQKIFNHPHSSDRKFDPYDSGIFAIDKIYDPMLPEHASRMDSPEIRNNWRKTGTTNTPEDYYPNMTIGVKLKPYTSKNHSAKNIDFEFESFALFAKFHSLKLNYITSSYPNEDPNKIYRETKNPICKRDFEVHYANTILFKLTDHENFAINLKNKLFSLEHHHPDINTKAANLEQAFSSKKSKPRFTIEDGLLTIHQLSDDYERPFSLDGLKRLRENSLGFEGSKKDLLSKQERELVETVVEIYNTILCEYVPNFGGITIVKASRKIPKKKQLDVYLEPTPVYTSSSEDMYHKNISADDDFNIMNDLSNKLSSSDQYRELALSFAQTLPSYSNEIYSKSNALHHSINNSLINELFKERGYQLDANCALHMPHSNYQSSLQSQAGYQTNETHLKNFGITVRIFLRDHNGVPLNFKDVGSGLGYVLPVLQSIHSKWSSNYFIQQPELHLHPALQSSLADVFVGAISKSGKKYIVETHSEHFLLRLLKRIKQTETGKLIDKTKTLTPDDVSIYYFDAQIDGSTKVHNIRISRQGDFMDRWPKGFFEERYSELFDE